MRRRIVALLAAVLVLAGGSAALDATGVAGPGLLRGDDDAAAPPSSAPAPPSLPAAVAPEPTPTFGAAPPVLSLLRPGAPASAAGISAALAPLLSAPGLGPSVGAAVVDADTGAVLLDRLGGQGRTPASVAKLVTGAALLAAADPEERLRTTVRAGAAAGEVVLVGGGDATLTTEPAGGYPATGSLRELARDTAAALRPLAPAAVAVRVDDSLFVGPPAAPAWGGRYVPNLVMSPVSALPVDLVDGHRAGDPAIDTGRRFAALLAEEGIPVAGDVARAVAPPPPATPPPAPPPPAPRPVLAEVVSPPVGVLVEHMLTTSDNDLAEALARVAALRHGEEASFDGWTRTATAVLQRLGVPAEGVILLDGSGLARGSVLPPRTVTALLSVAADDDRPSLRPVLTGLAVAGLTGTLDDRFEAAPTTGGAGAVRAKTGTLTGVTSLAGTAVTADGGLLAFAFLADEVANALEARAALDAAATTLAACGCPAP